MRLTRPVHTAPRRVRADLRGIPGLRGIFGYVYVPL